jgi:single-strand DNA-binding protein
MIIKMKFGHNYKKMNPEVVLMNKIVLIGRLTKDPIRSTIEESGKVYTKFTLAVDRQFGNVKKENNVDFIPVIMWGKRAEIVSEYMTKGKMISIVGRLQMGSYLDKDGTKKYTADVVADEFQFVG